MISSAVRTIQTRLQALGLYAGAIDGDRGPLTHDAVRRALEARAGDLPAGWRGWTGKRQSVAFLQLMCADAGIEVGPIDGRWGPQTDFAYGALAHVQATGAPPPPFRDLPPATANPSGFPAGTPAGLAGFYGPHGEPDGFRPPMVMVDCPWRLKIAWDQRLTRSGIWCHEKAADSLGRVLAEVRGRYSDAEIARLGLDLFGGDYNPRRKRGGTEWSTHSWGIAIDWHPDRNKLKWGRDRASLAHADCDEWWGCWEAEGWTSLGRAKNFDWMHVQAARV